MMVEVGCLVMAVGLLMMVLGCLMMVGDHFDSGCGLVVDGGQVLVILDFVGFVRER